ncbi:hypothetical protein TRVL_04690 [Trypanosoma vivax]|nr:hypothetical protein TRVL_04690 [Trypanosoma vivax]
MPCGTYVLKLQSSAATGKMSVQFSSSLPPQEEADFYKNTVFQWLQDSSISATPGSEMARSFREELIRAEKSNESVEYRSVLCDIFKVLADSLISAAHRSAPYVHINRSVPCDYQVTKDEDELLMTDGIFDSDDERDMDNDSDGGRKPLVREKEQSQRKREELRKKRSEEEAMLLTQKKVSDDKGNLLNTLGPFPAPRLTVRATTYTFPSRRTLEQRTALPSSDSESERGDGDGGPVSGASVPCSSGDEEAVTHLTSFMMSLSTDSLKKISESAKVKLKPSSTNRDYVTQIVKTAVRLGCEKACVLMDKHKIIEEMTSRVQTGPLHTAASIDFLQSLPEQLKHALGHMLGLWEESPPVEDMWERMVAMGFLAVLTNLRLKPLKRIASELNVSTPDTNSTEKFCEAIVFAAFPRERIRAKNLRSKRQKTLNFTVPPEGMRCKGDMGFITFHVENISILPKDNERRYSPEFEYGPLKWSLLCMANKEYLALYLCQTGSVFCKFLITVVNHLNVDDSICNEGTQRFSTRSQENDWGFNTVIKFEDLLNPRKGFWKDAGDSVTIEVGIVLVEAPKPNSAVKGASNKDKQAGPKVDEKAMQQLIEDEKNAQMRKKIRQEITKTVKDEEKTRKDITQRGIKGFHDITERFKTEKQRIIKELAERERREQLERQREQEMIKQAQEQDADIKRHIEEMKLNNVNLQNERKELMREIKELRRVREELAQQLSSIISERETLERTAQHLKEQIEASTQQYNDPQQPDQLAAAFSCQGLDGNEDSELRHLHESLERIIGVDGRGI